MAATDLEKLVVQLSADFKSFEKGMARASGVANKQFNAIERRARQMNKNLDGIGKQAARSIIAPLAGIGAALGARELIKLTDTWTDLTSRVNIAAGSMEAGTEVMGRLGEMARRTYSSLEQTVESYVANSTALKELGYTTSQQLDYTEALNNALVISAAKGQRAAQIQDALAKAMAGGKLSGQELNTVIQSGGRVAEALAKGLGVGVNQLRALGAAGKITSRDVFKALTSQMETLRKEAESMPATISDGIQLLGNALLEYVGNADSAAGISAKISEALVIIADNFDTVADAGLRVAAVFAAGLLGRSVANMVKTLGLGSAALVNFGRALSAARTMASLQVAFGGLAAAAGPAGIVIGAGLATALVVAQANAQATEDRIGRLNVEMERLGNKGHLAKEGVDEAAEAIDRLADKEIAARLKDVNDELDRLRGGGAIFGQGDEFGSIISKANNLKTILSGFGGSLFGANDDTRALDEIRRVSEALRTSQITAKEAREAVASIGKQTGLSEQVVELNKQLEKTVDWYGKVRVNEFADGGTKEIDDLVASVVSLTDQYDTLAMRNVVDPKQLSQIDDIRDRLKQGGEAAVDAAKELYAFASSNPNFEGLAQTLDPVMNMLALFIQQTREAAAEFAALSGGASKASIEAYQQYGASRVAGRVVDESSAAYIKEAERRAALGKGQLALETEIARVREQSLKDGEMLTDSQIKRVAEINLSGNASRGAEGKKPKKEREDEYARLTTRIKEQTAALIAETAAQAGVNPLVDDYGRAATEAAMAQDILTAAKKAGTAGASELHDVQQLLHGDLAGMSPAARELAESIRLLVGGYADADVAGQKLAETQDKIKQRAEEMADFQKDLTRGIVDGFIQGKNAADIFADALSKVGNKLLDLAFNAAFDTKSGGFNIGDIFKSMFREQGGPVKKGQPYIVGEKRPELFVPDSNGKILPSVPSAPTMPSLAKAGGGSAGAVQITYAPVYHVAEGADPRAIAELRQAQAKDRAEFSSKVISTVRGANKGRQKFG